MGRNKIHYKCQEKLKKTKQIKSIKINDKVESSPKILSDSFNNFFVTIAEIIDENIIYIYINANYKDCLENSVTSSFFLKPIQPTRKKSIQS